MGRAAAVASCRGATHSVFIWHVFDKLFIQNATFVELKHVSVLKPSKLAYSFGFGNSLPIAWPLYI